MSNDVTDPSGIDDGFLPAPDKGFCGVPAAAAAFRSLASLPRPVTIGDFAEPRYSEDLAAQVVKAIEPDVEALKPTIDTTNPKDALGSVNLPLHLFPPAAIAAGCIGMMGAYKYGRNNFRASPVRATIYIDALLRHTFALLEGEEVDPVDKVPHVCAILANAAILVDAKAAGTLIDDRNYNGSGYRKGVDELTPHVKRLMELHKDRNPRHWTIADNPKS